MLLKNTKETYGLIAKAFHWPTAIIIMALILVGLYMGSMENGPDKLQVYMLHKSFGILVLWLVGLRIVWRLINTQPAALPNHKPWERILAKLAHLAL
ncbi:MAG TPA: cytochrome b/b6 domain-containing protein, partial [Alphaproteobacteria bacterium]|nr:cytochrome b/b6 domain-containing protein [Alphaproteobacteria bacterium]